MSKLSELHNYPPIPKIQRFNDWRAAYAPNYPDVPAMVNRLVSKDVFIGLEVEVEHANGRAIDIDHTFWDAKEDNSLRNMGIEFVSKALISDQICYALSNLAKALPPEVTFSQRTSVHVHMNVRDLIPEQAAKVLLVYCSVERLLYRFAGYNRDKNIFCVPLYDLRLSKKLYHYLKEFPNQGRPQDNNLRYSGANFDPVQTFGSIEFRHLHGTKDPERLLTWVNLLLSIRKYALATELGTLLEEILALNTNSAYKVYAHKVFGNLVPVFPLEHLNADVEVGVLSVKRTIFSGTFHNKITSTISKNSNAALFVKENMQSLKSKYSYVNGDIAPNPLLDLPRDFFEEVVDIRPAPLQGQRVARAARPNPWIDVQNDLNEARVFQPAPPQAGRNV